MSESVCTGAQVQALGRGLRGTEARAPGAGEGVCVCQCVIAGEYLAWSLGSQILRTRRPRPNPGEVIGSGGQLRPTWLSVCLTEGEQGSGTDTGLSLCLWAVSPGIYSVCV